MLNIGSVDDVFLEIFWNYSEKLFWKKTFRWMFHISLKKTSEWVLLMRQPFKKILVEVNPHSCPWTQIGTTAVAVVMILEVMNDWRSLLQINVCRKFMLHNTWLTYVYMFDRNSGGKTSQIEGLFESNLRFLGYFECATALWLLWTQLQRQLAYKSWLGASGPDCYLTPRIGHLQKTEVVFKS